MQLADLQDQKVRLGSNKAEPAATAELEAQAVTSPVACAWANRRTGAADQGASWQAWPSKELLGACQAPNMLNYNDAPGCLWLCGLADAKLATRTGRQGGSLPGGVWRDAKITTGVERFFCSIFQGTLCKNMRISLFSAGASQPRLSEDKRMTLSC